MVQVDVSHYMSFFGGHDFKVGFGRMKNVNKVQEGYPGGGYITLWWDSAFPNPVDTTKTDRGTYGYYTLDTIGTRGSRAVPLTISMCRIAGGSAA